MIAAGPADHTLVGPDLDLDEGGFVDAVRERSLPATRVRARFLRRVVLFRALLESGLPANGRSGRAGRGRISRAKTVVSVDGEVTSGLGEPDFRHADADGEYLVYRAVNQGDAFCYAIYTLHGDEVATASRAPGSSPPRASYRSCSIEPLEASCFWLISFIGETHHG